MSETERTESCRILRSLVDLQLHGEDVRNSGRHRDRETVNKGYDKGATWTAGIEPDTLVLEAAIGPSVSRSANFWLLGNPCTWKHRARDRRDGFPASARKRDQQQSLHGVAETTADPGWGVDKRLA
ncbi:hypothetical protein TcBrA4_0052320 [Trypanosoma cruzi]|nr:hypothetical protein TcBrA4_0052320 [Trypanosoma cruzi]